MSIPEQIAALNAVWPHVDSFGRNYSDAANVALARAIARPVAGESDALTADDVRALVIMGAVADASLRSSAQPEDARARAVLAGTWADVAAHAGYTGKPPPAPSPASPAGNLIVIVGILVGVAAQVAIVAWLIYNAKDLADRELARRAADREMVRLNARMLALLNAHKAGEPWTPEERAELDAIEAAMTKLRGGMVATPPEGHAPEAFGAGVLATIAAAAVAAYYLFLRPRRA